MIINGVEVGDPERLIKIQLSELKARRMKIEQLMEENKALKEQLDVFCILEGQKHDNILRNQGGGHATLTPGSDIINQD